MKSPATAAVPREARDRLAQIDVPALLRDCNLIVYRTKNPLRDDVLSRIAMALASPELLASFKVNRVKRRVRLTPCQIGLLTRIAESVAANGYAPTLQELADAQGVSKVTVFEHLNTLEVKGVIRRTRKARSIEIVDE